MHDKTILEVKTPRSGEETPEAMVQFLASLASIKSPKSFWGTHHIPFSFEIAFYDQTVHFCIVIPSGYRAFLESQLLSQYPKALISEVKKDYLDGILHDSTFVNAVQLKLQS